MAMDSKEIMKDILRKLEQGVKDIFTSENYERYLKVMSSFHKYSVNNSILIALQKPDATLVAGYNAWKEKKRQVLKGQKAIRILAPQPYNISQEREVAKLDSKGSPIFENGKAVTEKKLIEIKGTNFVPASVFDISQTRGEPLPSLKKIEELNGVMPEKDIIISALKDTAKIPIEYEKMGRDKKGYYNWAEQRIAIKEGMSDMQTVKTCIHEVAHKLMHDPAQKDMDTLGNSTKEVQAESVAYVVANRFGLDTGDYSFGYIAAWSKDKELKDLKKSLSEIQKTAEQIIDGIQNRLDKTINKGKIIEDTKDDICKIERELKENRAILEQWKKNHELNCEFSQEEKKILVAAKKDIDKYIELSKNKNTKEAELQGAMIKEKYGITSPQDYNNRAQKQIQRQEFIKYDKDAITIKSDYIKTLEKDIDVLKRADYKAMVEKIKYKFDYLIPEVEKLSKTDQKALFEFTRQFPNIKTIDGIQELKKSIESNIAAAKELIAKTDDNTSKLVLKGQLANLNPQIKIVLKALDAINKIMNKRKEMSRDMV